ncbi:hypothetical protein [Nocardioides sp.]|uniref:hypothetical protein n=1 Tax=Nocardioides sp. TaxID=35761 RepID=UPI003784F041
MSQIPFDPHGLLLRRTAVRSGLDDNWLHRMVKDGALVHIRHGAYADPAVWLPASPAARHVLLGRAVMRQYDDRVALSHASAHLRRGGPDWRLDLATVNLTNLFGRGDREQAGITHHRGWVGVHDITRTDGHWITTPGRTAVETAAGLALAPAVCVLDWTLHLELTSPAEIQQYAVEYMRDWPGTVGLPEAVGRSNGKSESVGESRGRILLEDAGLHPQPQWEVFHPSGRLAGRTDFRIESLRLIVEFDGLVKYGRLLKPGQSLDDVIKAERAREVLLEELTGYRMFRMIWTDLDRPAQTIDRIHRVAAARLAG